VHMPILLL